MSVSNDHFGPVPVVPLAEPTSSGVTADVPCRKCQYNLRGLSVDGRCPECGTPVGYSTRGDLLRYSDPQWVATLRTGVSTILWGILASILASLAGTTLQRVGYGPLPTLTLSLIAGLLSLAGAWLLTTPDPSGLGEDRYGTSRKVIRVTLVVGLVQQVSMLFQQTAHWPPLANLIFAVTGVVAGLISVVGTFATLNYLSKLAQRIPDPSLEGRARLLMYGYGVPLAVLAVVGGAFAIFARGGGLRGGPGPAFMAFGCVAGIAGVTLLVFAIMYLFMLGRFSKAFKTQAAIARSTWARDPASLAAPPPTP